MFLFEKSLFNLSLFYLCFCFLTYKSQTDGMVHRAHISHSGIRSVESQNTEIFVDSLFEKYGINGSMNLEQFKNLLKTLEIGDNRTKTTAELYAGKSNRDVKKNKVGKVSGICNAFRIY